MQEFQNQQDYFGSPADKLTGRAGAFTPAFARSTSPTATAARDRISAGRGHRAHASGTRRALCVRLHHFAEFTITSSQWSTSRPAQAEASSLVDPGMWRASRDTDVAERPALRAHHALVAGTLATAPGATAASPCSTWPINEPGCSPIETGNPPSAAHAFAAPAAGSQPCSSRRRSHSPNASGCATCGSSDVREPHPSASHGRALGDGLLRKAQTSVAKPHENRRARFRAPPGVRTYYSRRSRLRHRESVPAAEVAFTCRNPDADRPPAGRRRCPVGRLYVDEWAITDRLQRGLTSAVGVWPPGPREHPIATAPILLPSACPSRRRPRRGSARTW